MVYLVHEVYNMNLKAHTYDTHSSSYSTISAFRYILTFRLLAPEHCNLVYVVNTLLHIVFGRQFRFCVKIRLK